MEYVACILTPMPNGVSSSPMAIYTKYEVALEWVEGQLRGATKNAKASLAWGNSKYGYLGTLNGDGSISWIDVNTGLLVDLRRRRPDS